MLIVESQADAAQSGWTDPLVDTNVYQFLDALGRMRKLSPTSKPSELDEAYDLSMLLCDASRQIVYRLHRVTRGQLTDLCDAFDEACQCISDWNITSGTSETHDLILDFAKHIADRSSRLSLRLND